MKKPIRQIVPHVLLVNLACTGPTWAQSLTDETRLQAAHKGIDNDAGERLGKDKAKALARQFQLPTKFIDELQHKKLGWGEMTIQFVMAQHLTKTDLQTYPSLAEARQRVEELRIQGKGWGSIAKKLGVKLGPVVSEVCHVRKTLREEGRAVPFRVP